MGHEKFLKRFDGRQIIFLCASFLFCFISAFDRKIHFLCDIFTFDNRKRKFHMCIFLFLSLLEIALMKCNCCIYSYIWQRDWSGLVHYTIAFLYRVTNSQCPSHLLSVGHWALGNHSIGCRQFPDIS